MKLKTKLSIFTTSIIIVIVAVISYSLFVYVKSSRYKDIMTDQRTTMEHFIHLAKEALVVRDELLLLNTMRALKSTYNGIVYLNYINNSQGRILYTDREMSARIVEQRNLDRTITRTYSPHRNERIFEITQPVSVNNENIGVLQIGFSQKYYDEMVAGTIEEAGKRILLISLACLILGLAVSVFLSRTLAGPIRKLTVGAQEIGEGRLDTRIDVKTNDELGMLADEFNQMAQRLAELDRAKDDFVNAVSHELRTPLSAIEGYIDYLIEGGERITPDKKDKALNIMKSSSRRLAAFINDILDVAKIKASKMYFDMEPRSMLEVTEKSVKLFEVVAEQKGIKLEVAVQENIPRVSIDEERIRQVFTNLIGNAMKFTPEDGTITVGAEIMDARFVRAYVRDTGPGIPKEDLRKIFVQFEQSEGARKVEGQKGTGLGLTIAEGIVRSHGGRIWVESVVGEGTVFSFTLPISTEEDE